MYSSVEVDGEIFQKFLLDHARSTYDKQQQKVHTVPKEIQELGYWLGDLAIVYVKRTSTDLEEVTVEVSFP